MGAINILLGGFTLIIFLLVFMQPVLILVDQASVSLNASNSVKYGTDSDGNVVEVGDSVWGLDFLIGLIAAIGFAFFLGFVIWAGRGGKDPYEEAVSSGGFR